MRHENETLPLTTVQLSSMNNLVSHGIDIDRLRASSHLQGGGEPDET